MRQKKKWGLCCIILLITVAFATGCYGKKSKSQEAVQTCEFLSEQTAEIEKGYLDENGYIQSDDMKALLEEVSSSAEVLFAEGKITDYAYKAGDTCVYMKIDDWLSTVEFEHILNEGEEYAIITGLDDSNQEVWTVTTEKYPQIKLTSIEEIGAYDDRYYYNEGGTVKALDMSDGTLLWQNSDFGGASIHSIIDDTGMLYLCGYYGPDFFAVNLEGSTLCRIESFDENYYWPCNIEKKENSIEVTLEGGTEGNLNDSVFSVSLVDYSYSMVHKNDNDMMELSAAQLKYVQEQLGVPMDLEVETTQGEPVYWEAGACWTIYVSIYQQNSIIAAANVNPENSELVKDIYQYNSTEIETSAVINETWLQEDVTDPLMFEFYEDGSVFYMPTVSREAEYTTKYKIEDDILTIDLVEIGATGVVPVSYKITYQDSKVYLELIDIDDDVDISRLYGWESIIPGWYVR